MGRACIYRRAADGFEAAGFRPGLFFVGFTIGLEALARIGLIFGIFPKVAAALAVVVLSGASYAVVRTNDRAWRWQKTGPEYPVFWALACFITIVA